MAGITDYIVREQCGTGRLGDYVLEQYRIAQQAKTNAAIARKIAENCEKTRSYSDTLIKIMSNNERSTGIDPVDGTRSTDFVYRKISKAVERARNPHHPNPYWGLAGIISDHVIKLQIKMENRTMTREEYRHLERTSINNLLKEWSEEINARLSRTA
jgi:hypothetical protein